MIRILSLAAALSLFTARSQSIQTVDSLTYEFCDFLKESQLSDKKKYEVLNEELIIPYLRKLKNTDPEQVYQQIFFRMQRNCLELILLLERLDPRSQEKERMVEKPKTQLSSAQIEEFKKISKFYYLESDGVKTKVVVKDGKWLDKFKDKSFSKLHMRWIGEAEFELEFIESNNITRKNLSIPGDKYNYQVISKEDKFYWMSYNVPGQANYTKFKLYFK